MDQQFNGHTSANRCPSSLDKVTHSCTMGAYKRTKNQVVYIIFRTNSLSLSKGTTKEGQWRRGHCAFSVWDKQQTTMARFMLNSRSDFDKDWDQTQNEAEESSQAGKEEMGPFMKNNMILMVVMILASFFLMAMLIAVSCWYAKKYGCNRYTVQTTIWRRSNAGGCGGDGMYERIVTQEGLLPGDQHIGNLATHRADPHEGGHH